MAASRARRRIAFLGVDVGSSACKAVIVDQRCRLLAEAQHPIAIRRTAAGEVSHDARTYLDALARAVRSCVRSAGTVDISALGVTAPAHYVVATDAALRPVMRTLLASDRRPAAIAERIQSELGHALYEHTFVRLTSGWSLPQVAFLRQESREAWGRVRHVLVAKDYVRAVLTGEIATDPSDAAGTALYDQRRMNWWPPAIDAAGLRADQLPPIVPAISIGGPLNRAWSRRLGLPADLPVAVGATDTAAELVSVGAVDVGACIVKIATTGTVVAVTGHPFADPRLLTYPHALSGRWYTLAATNSAAASLRWLQEDVFREDDIAAISREAARVAAGADGVLFLPFLDGERSPYWDASLRGALVGLASHHTRAHLARAVLEGVALSLRTCRDLMESVGLRIDDPVLTGGGVRGELWRDILVAVLGRRAYLAKPHGPAIGAAILAAAAVGSMDARAAAPVLTRMTATAAQRAAYDRAHSAYLEAADVMTALSTRLYRHV
jgi:xylulokinase